MFDRKSDYALNKRHPDSIVCKSVTDVHIYLTRADFSSEADFLKWKEWSDRNYHQMDKAGRGFYDNCLPLDEWIDSMEPSAEELLLRDIEQAGQEANCAVLMAKIKSCLSTTQFRRLWMHYAEGKSVTEIAAIEGVSKAGISLALRAARKKVEKMLEMT